MNSYSLKAWKPKYPEFQIECVRHGTFAKWPKNNLKTEELAASGFFYIGFQDYVKCFYCGLGLKQWVESDIPYEEHKKYGQNCQFIKLISSSISLTQDKIFDAGGDGICKVCLLNPQDSLFLPCSHMVVCGKCASSLTNNKCCYCMEPFFTIIKVYKV